jgi:hypothetical protein
VWGQVRTFGKPLEYEWSSIISLPAKVYYTPVCNSLFLKLKSITKEIENVEHPNEVTDGFKITTFSTKNC